MRLAEYLRIHHMTAKQFAVWLTSVHGLKVGLSRVYTWLNGTVPRPAMIQRIFEITDGEIGPEDWFTCIKRGAKR
jgi:hypothetical protein